MAHCAKPYVGEGWATTLALNQKVKMTTFKKKFVPYKLAKVNQHPPVYHEGWMISCQETVFCWLPVP
jgi:hypothetical protein